MPSSRTVYDWLDNDKTFSAGFARARELGGLAWIEEGVHTARTTEMGQVVTYKSDGSVEMRREDMLGHRRLKSDVFFKAAAKICPSKYGDKVALVGGSDTDAPIQSTIRVVERNIVRNERLTD